MDPFERSLCVFLYLSKYNILTVLYNYKYNNCPQSIEQKQQGSKKKVCKYYYIFPSSNGERHCLHITNKHLLNLLRTSHNASDQHEVVYCMTKRQQVREEENGGGGGGGHGRGIKNNMLYSAKERDENSYILPDIQRNGDI